ncbi:MAG TPA: hypothetical protein VFQ44_25265, partial [Streptosporangiaceae bacterium]|nr:hypothetical protein [Streptosporangiaceae bacterium]
MRETHEPDHGYGWPVAVQKLPETYRAEFWVDMDEPDGRGQPASETTDASTEPEGEQDGRSAADTGASEEDSDIEADDDDQDKFWRALSLNKRIPAPIRRLARRRSASIMASQALRYWRSKDPEDNKDTSIPAGESICVPVIWATELYTPTTFAGLKHGLSSLLDKATDRYGIEDIIEWLQSARRRASGAWRILPPIVPDGQRILGSKIVDTLPEGVSSAQVAIYMLTSAVAAVTVRFRLNDERSRGLEAILTSDKTTQAEMRADGGFSILDVPWQKQKSVEAWHTDLQADVTRWLADRLPGSFCGFESAKLPVIELSLTSQVRSWDDTSPRNQKSDRWLSLLDLTDSDASGFWQCINLPWLRLRERTPLGWIRSRLHIVTMASRRSDLLGAFPPPASATATADQQLNQALHLFDFYAMPIVNRWALTALVSEMEDELRVTCDLAQVTSKARSGRQLDRLQQQLLHFGVDGQ